MARHTKEEFDDELFRILQEARGEGKKLHRVVSKHLHDRVVTEAGNHRMPAACDAMWRLCEEQGSRQKGLSALRRKDGPPPSKSSSAQT